MGNKNGEIADFQNKQNSTINNSLTLRLYVFNVTSPPLRCPKSNIPDTIKNKTIKL